MENWKLKIFVESVILKVEETIQIAQHVKKLCSDFTQRCSVFKFSFNHSFYTTGINVNQGRMFFRNMEKHIVVQLNFQIRLFMLISLSYLLQRFNLPKQNPKLWYLLNFPQSGRLRGLRANAQLNLYLSSTRYWCDHGPLCASVTISIKFG